MPVTANNRRLQEVAGIRREVLRLCDYPITTEPPETGLKFLVAECLPLNHQNPPLTRVFWRFVELTQEVRDRPGQFVFHARQ